MDYSRRTAQLLHEEHRASIAMIEALEELIARAGRTAPDTGEAQIRGILERISAAIESEVRNHFSFEENELFTRLEEFGDSGIAGHLREEHRAILPLGERVAAMAGAALEGGFSQSGWPQFKAAAGELIERMLAHIQKEEMALLPMLEELLDPQTDMQLAEVHSRTQ